MPPRLEEGFANHRRHCPFSRTCVFLAPYRRQPAWPRLLRLQRAAMLSSGLARGRPGHRWKQAHGADRLQGFPRAGFAKGSDGCLVRPDARLRPRLSVYQALLLRGPECPYPVVPALLQRHQFQAASGPRSMVPEIPETPTWWGVKQELDRREKWAA